MLDQYKAIKKRISNTYKSIRNIKNPNIVRLAREFDVLVYQLRRRIKGRLSCSTR